MTKFKILVIGIVTLLSFSCKKDNNELRIENKSAYALDVTVGVVDFQRIQPGETSSYKQISRGEHELGGNISGTVILDRKGERKWTITIEENLVDLTLRED